MFQIVSVYIHIYNIIYIYKLSISIGDDYTVTTFKYVEGGPDREAREVVWNTSSYI